MRIITLKWANDCAQCDQHLEVGQEAEYEKTTGIFCKGHFPVDAEQIRHFRQLKADAKSAKYEQWADSHQRKADQRLGTARSMASVIPFGQPILVGHHSEGRDRRYRARIDNNFRKAFEEKTRADELRRRAESIRNVSVKGDADKKRDEKRLAVDAWVKVGMDVQTWVFGVCKVVKINQKTVKVQGKFSAFNVDKSFLDKI